MLIRKLNSDGLKEFENFIENLRNGARRDTPFNLLTDVKTSEEIPDSIEIDQKEFSNRYELGNYLVGQIGDTDIQGHMGDIGFWSALALFWFDQLCPKKQDGSRKPSMSYNYILSEKYNHRPRHAIYSTWQLASQYGEHAKFLLCREMPVRGELIEQMLARQYFLGCEGVMKAASKLYYDEESHSFKRGAAARKSAGCISRYVSWLQQIELTYDLFSISSEDLLTILPSEFDRFRPPVT